MANPGHSGQLSDSKIHSGFILRNEITKILAILRISIFPKHEKCAPPYTSLDLVQKFSSDRLWAPLLYVSIRTVGHFQLHFKEEERQRRWD